MDNQSKSDVDNDEDLTPRTYREHNWLSRPVHPKQLPNDVSTWRINHVLDWLGTHVCLPEYKTQFARLSVDGISLLTLNKYLLENEFEINSEVHCTKIEQHILALKEGRRADHTNWEGQFLGHGLVPETESVNAPRFNNSQLTSPRLHTQTEANGDQRLEVQFPESELLDDVGPLLKASLAHDGSSTYLHADAPPPALSRNASSKSHVPADYLYPFGATVKGPTSPSEAHIRGSKFSDQPKPSTYYPVNGPAVLMKNNRVNLESWRWSGGSFEVDTGGQIISINDNKTGKGGDVILGVWTCCQSVDPLSAPCHTYKRGHSAVESKCVNCGIFFRLRDGYPGPCRYHAVPEPSVVNAYGSVMWTCCGTYGMKDSKYVLDRTGANRERHGCQRGAHVPEFQRSEDGATCTRCGKAGVTDWSEPCKRHPGLFCLYRRIRKITHEDAHVKRKVFVKEKDVKPLPPDMLNAQGDIDQACQMIPPQPLPPQPNPVMIKMHKIIPPPFCPLSREQVFGEQQPQTIPGPIPQPAPPRHVNQAIVIPPLEPLDLDPHLVGEDVISPDPIAAVPWESPWDPLNRIPAISCPPPPKTRNQNREQADGPRLSSNQTEELTDVEVEQNVDGMMGAFEFKVETAEQGDQSALPMKKLHPDEHHLLGKQSPKNQSGKAMGSISSEAVLISSTVTLKFSEEEDVLEKGMDTLRIEDRLEIPGSNPSVLSLGPELNANGAPLIPKEPELPPDLRKHILTNQVAPPPEPSVPPPNLAKYRFTDPPAAIEPPSVAPKSDHFEGICSLDPPMVRPARAMVPPRIYIKAAVYPPKPQNIQPPTKPADYRCWQYEMRHEVPPTPMTPNPPPERMARMMVNIPSVAEDVVPNFPVCDFHCLRRTYKSRWISVFNRTHRPITVHPARHMAEAPKGLQFDREYAWGFRLRAKTVFPPRGNTDVELLSAEAVANHGPARSRQTMVPVSFLWKDPDSVGSRKIRHLLREHCGPLKYFPEAPTDGMHSLEKKCVHTRNAQSMGNFNSDNLVANPKAGVKDMAGARGAKSVGSLSMHLGRVNMKKVELPSQKQRKRRSQLNRARPPSSLAQSPIRPSTKTDGHFSRTVPAGRSVSPPVRRVVSAPSVHTIPYNEAVAGGRLSELSNPQSIPVKGQNVPEAVGVGATKKAAGKGDTFVPRFSRNFSAGSVATEFVSFAANSRKGGSASPERPQSGRSHRDDFTIRTDEYGTRPSTARSYDTNFEWQPESRSTSALMMRPDIGEFQDNVFDMSRNLDEAMFGTQPSSVKSANSRPQSAGSARLGTSEYYPMTPPQQPKPPSVSASTGRMRNSRQGSGRFRAKGWKEEGFFSGAAGYSPPHSGGEYGGAEGFQPEEEDIRMPPLDLHRVASPVDKQLLQQELDRLLRRGSPRPTSSRKESPEATQRTVWRDAAVDATATWGSKNMYPDGTLHKVADTREVERERIRVKRVGKNKFKVLGQNPRTITQPENDSWLFGLN